jgi:DNA-binding NarL/FixJ family response regulator
MTTSDYLINAVFVLVVLRQARERQVSVRGLVAPLAEVLRLIATGLSSAEIAEALVVSHATVKTQVNRIFSKTASRDRAQAVRYAYRHGIA